MSDIVERLHDLADANKPHAVGLLWDGLTEAADEIERLRAALRDIIERWPTEEGMDGAIRRARTALSM